MQALQYKASTPNGVYAYGSAARFPSYDGSGANYRADVVFSAASISPTYTVTMAPATGQPVTVDGAAFIYLCTFQWTAGGHGRLRMENRVDVIRHDHPCVELIESAYRLTI